MADQDWPYGYKVVTARDASGRNALPTRVGLKRTAVGLAVAAECGDQQITFPIPEATQFIAALRVAIEQHTQLPMSEQ